MTDDPVPNHAPVDARRSFLRTLAAGLGGLAFTGDAFGQSLLLRTPGPSGVAMPITIPTTVPVWLLDTFSNTHWEGGTDSYTLTSDERLHGTESFTSQWFSYSNVWTYTHATMGQTLTVHATQSSYYWPPITFEGWHSHDGTVYTSSRSINSTVVTWHKTTTKSATYTTTTDPNMSVEPGSIQLMAGADEAPKDAITTIDLGVDLMDARTRRGAPLRLDLAR